MGPPPAGDTTVIEVSRPGIMERIAEWLSKQSSNTVLNFAILGAIGYGAWYGVPAMIATIQQGYDRHLQYLERMLDKERDANNKWHAELIDRIERKLDDK